MIESRSVVALGEEELAGMGLVGTFWADGNVLYLTGSMDYMGVYKVKMN